MAEQLVIGDLKFKSTGVPFPEKCLVVGVNKWKVILR
jgi:hypothetical protein